MSEESQSQDGKKSPSMVAASDAAEAQCGAQVDASTHTSQTNIAQVKWFIVGANHLVTSECIHKYI